MKNIEGALGRGWSFPPRFTLQEGVVMAVDYERIRQSLRTLFSTLPGERIARESFGCDLHQYLFLNIGDALFSRIRATIDEAIRRYEPRIEPLSVNLEKSPLEAYRLLVQVTYRVRNNSEIQRLSGELDLMATTGGGRAWVS